MNLRCGGVTTRPPVIGAQALVAGVGEDCHGRAVCRVLDQSQLSGRGDVGTACQLCWTGEQESAAGVGEDHGLDGVLLVLVGDELLPVLASGGGPADPDLGAADDAPVFPLVPR